MADVLHMAQLRLDPRALQRTVKHTFGLRASEDVGYHVHSLLGRLFHELAPKPFHVRTVRGQLDVLGYTHGDETALREHLALAEPLLLRTIVDGPVTKVMPTPFANGRRLGFEVRLCPVARLARNPDSGAKRGPEVDVFVQAVLADKADSSTDGETPIDRQALYVEWLRQQLAAGARLQRAELRRFRLARLFRQHQANGAGPRKAGPPRMQRPDALLEGVLEVTDSEAFGRLLARGVGRHRAFGFGMLLLRAGG